MEEHKEILRRHWDHALRSKSMLTLLLISQKELQIREL